MAERVPRSLAQSLIQFGQTFAMGLTQTMSGFLRHNKNEPGMAYLAHPVPFYRNFRGHFRH